MDGGFKEGIDLFDVKHVHIFEPQTSNANTKQAIGRATRTCGQKGLNFNARRGWPLNVYIYDTELSQKDKSTYKVSTLHELFLTGLDLRKFVLADEIERYAIVSSIDYNLNKNIHNFKLESDFDMPPLESFFTKTRFGGGTNDKVDCAAKCGKSPTDKVPVSVAQMLLAWLSMGRIVSKTKKERIREYLCYHMKRDKVFCQKLNEVYENTKQFCLDNDVIIFMYIDKLDENYKRQVQKILDTYKIPQPPKIQPFILKQKLINSVYGQYAWPKVAMENLCEVKPDALVKTTDFKFTPTQEFVRHYFTPNVPEKGLLLFHSVGTGKTCTAIATASSSFEQENYTILWVTRTTLKSDVWKNMFDQVCNMNLKEKIDNGLKLPSDLTKKKKLLSKSWTIEPISYKQFTNLITGKNKQLQEKLVGINGTKDMLKKTLLIIDEAHKLYGGHDLPAQERPNMPKLYEMLQNSYKESKEDSVKVLLMTATPYTNDPMEFVKLLNLIREKPISEDFETFSKTYLNETGSFTNSGKVMFMNEVSGLISYLNRELDARQFAQANITKQLVSISKSISPFSSSKELKSHYKNLIKQNTDKVDDLKEEKRTLKKRATEYTKEIKTKKVSECTGDKRTKEECKERVRREKAELVDRKEQVQQETKDVDKVLKETENYKKEITKKQKEDAKLLKTDFSQEKLFKEKCGV